MAYQTFQDFMKNNPVNGPSINEVAQQAAQPQSRGFLADAITNMINSGWKSLRTVPEFMLSYLPQKIGGGIKNVIESAQGTAKPIQSFEDIQYQPLLLNAEEGKQLNVDPVRQYMGSSAELGSYILPGALGAAKGLTSGARILSAAGHAAAGGALGGAGSGLKQDLTLPEILGQTGQGAVLGGALGGALQGGSEAFKGIANRLRPENIQNAGEKIQKVGVNEQMQGGLGVEAKQGKLDFMGARNTDQANIQKGLELAGIKGPPTPANVSKIPEALGNLREELVNNTPFTINADTLQQKLADKFINAGVMDDGQKALIEAGKIIDLMKGGKNLSPAEFMGNTFNLDQLDLHGLTQRPEIQSALNKFFKAVANKTEGMLPPIIQERKLADDLVKELFSSVSPEYNQINSIFGSLYRQNPNIVATVNAARPTLTSLGRANLGKVVQAPAEMAIGRAIEGVGKGVSGIGNLAENVSQSPLGNIFSKAGQTAGNVINRAIPTVAGPLAVAGMNQPQQQQGDILPTGVFDQQQNLYPGQSPDNIYTTPFNGTMPNPEIQTTNPYEKLPQLVQAGFTVKEAMDLLKGSSGTTMPGNIKSQVAVLNTGMSQIQGLADMINQGRQYFGRGQDTLGESLAGIFPNKDRAALKAKIGSVLYQVARAAHGAGVMSTQDITYFSKNLAPSFGDTPEEALAKLQEALSMLEDKYNAISAQYQQ